MARTSLKTIGLLTELASLLKVSSQTPIDNLSQLRRAVAAPAIRVLEVDSLRRLLGDKSETIRSHFAQSTRRFNEEHLQVLVDALKTSDGQSALNALPGKPPATNPKLRGDARRVIPRYDISQIVINEMVALRYAPPITESKSIGHLVGEMSGNDFDSLASEELMSAIEWRLEKTFKIRIPYQMRPSPFPETVGALVDYYHNVITKL